MSTASDQAMRNMIQSIRLYLRDYPQLNRLVAGEESSDRMIAFAIQDAVDDWNTTPPLIASISVESHPAISLLIRRASISLLQSVGLLQTRNHLTYSDGQGASVNSSDKAPQLQGWINQLSSAYENQKQRTKIALNIEGSYGAGVNSEIRLVGSYYGW